jgi:hypothetical protein
VSLTETLEETLQVVRDTAGEVPQIIATSAKDGGKRLSFPELRSRIAVPGPPFLLLLGTGWGLTEEVLDQANDFLEPIHGVGTYNHLSVRAAAAILLDRLLGAPSVN